MSSQADRSMPKSPTGRVLSIALRGYLALALAGLAGCASTRPAALPLEDAREIETRAIDADSDQAFDAVVTTLQDLSFCIDTAERDSGLIVASRESEEPMAVISRDPSPNEGGGMPTWAKVALVATGAIVVVAVVAALSHDDDDTPDRDAGRSRHRQQRHHHEGNNTELVVVNDGTGSPGPRIYEYRLTVNLKSVSDIETVVRVSAQGTVSRGEAVEQAGPIHDPDFFRHFFDHVMDATPLLRASGQ
jgi:hypothetical protein